MKKQLLYTFLLLNFIFHSPVIAQTSENETNVQVTKARLLGRTIPVRDMASAPATDQKKLKKAKKNRPHEVPNFFGREGEFGNNHNALPTDGDPVLQSNYLRDEGLQVVPKVNIQGIGALDSNSGVPDPCGDIGTQYYVQMVNATYFQIFDKEGNEVISPTTVNSFWSEFGQQSAGDPIVLYDENADRWLMTEFAPPGQNKLLVAISETGDPTGSWLVYEFSTPNFPDYPKYAVWNNTYYVTTNEFVGQSPIYFIDRAAMLSGADVVDMQRLTISQGNAPGFYVPTPVDWDGAMEPPADTPPMVFRIVDDSWSSGADRIQMWTFDIDWDLPNNSSVNGPVNIATQAFDSYPCSTQTGGFACVRQPDATQGIDAIPRVLMHRIPYRNFGTHESIVMTFVVDATAGSNVSGIRWVEMRKLPGETWSVYQEGTYAPEDGNHRFIAGIAMDGLGNIGMAYTVSGAETFPSLRFTGRRASDPLGEMTVEEYETSHGLSNSNTPRFGDYSSMSIDPVNDRTFWFTGQYMGPSSLWRTGIIAFEIQRDTIDIGILNLSSPQSALDLTDSETVTIEVKNFGRDTQTVFQVGYVFENEVPVIEDITTVLPPDSIYVHTFVQTVDMQLIKAYDLKVFTGLDGDQAVFNDTLRTSVANLPRYDAAITAITGIGEVVCGNETEVTLTLTNVGVNTLTDVEIHWQINSDTEQTMSWTGSLETGEMEEITVVISNLQNAINTLTAFTTNPNGEADEAPENDQISRSFQGFSEGVPIFLRLKTDDDPLETSWTLKDENGAILYSGDDYLEDRHTYYEEWCLDLEACYTFTIFDSNGDGMNNPFGQMTIKDGEGHELAGLMEFNFGFLEVHEFCVTVECLINATASVTPESVEGAMNGAIAVNAQNGGNNLLYSIDGGENFQTSALFPNLPSGIYQVVVQDGESCQFVIENVVVDIMTAGEWLLLDQNIELFPNPTEGVFKINIKGIPNLNNLDFSIRNAQGKIIQHNQLVRYNETLTGQFSLLAYPAGLYYIIFKDENIQKILKLVKN